LEYTTEIIQCSNGKNIIQHPILTPDEREKRMERLREATKRYARAMLDAQEKAKSV